MPVVEAIVAFVVRPFLVVKFMSTEFIIIIFSRGGVLCILDGSGFD